jgi:hypothetical protein
VSFRVRLSSETIEGIGKFTARYSAVLNLDLVFIEAVFDGLNLYRTHVQMLVLDLLYGMAWWRDDGVVSRDTNYR